MPNFTLSEIATVALVILIVFGPQRLPEMAQKAGQLVRKSRSIIADLRKEFEGEWSEVSEPLKEVRREVEGIKEEMGSSLRSLSEDVNKAKEEIEAEFAETKKKLEDQISETGAADSEEATGEQPTSGESPSQQEDTPDMGDET